MKRHLPTLLLLFAIVFFLFRLPLLHGYRFIGNSDRWNHYLSLAAFHAANFARGHLSAWCDFIFMGFDTLALPFTFVSPLFVLPPLFHTDDVVSVLGFVSPIILFLTLSTAYFVLHAICRERLPAVAGACVYALSTWSLLKLTQNDNSYLSVFMYPLLFALVRTTSPVNLHSRIAQLAALVFVCIYWSFLNYFAYVVIFLLAYSTFLATRGRRAPLVAVVSSLALATLLSLPRLAALFENLKGSTRTAGHLTVEYVSPVLFLRYLNGDIFGRSSREALRAHVLNLSEGNLLYASVFASLLMVWIVVSGRYRTTVGKSDARRPVRYGFCIAFILVVFLIVHFPPFYAIFRLLFLNVSFLHTRFAFAALLPIAVVSSLYLMRDPDWRPTPRAMLTTAAVMLAVLAVGWVDFDRLNDIVWALARHRPRTFIRVPGSGSAAVLGSETLRLGVLTVVFATLLLAARLRLLDPWALRTIVAVIIVAQAIAHADQFLNGSHTRTYTMPFESFDPVMAKPNEFHPPPVAQISILHARLDNEHYRSVLICPSTLISVDCSTGLGLTWRLRLADGYLSGVSERYASLPWPPSSVDVRAIRFRSIDGIPGGPLPWKLLALLNVRNAVIVNRKLFVADDVDANRDIEIVRNPSPYIYPRAYFASRTRAMSSQGAAEAIRREFGPCGSGANNCDLLLREKHLIDYVEGDILGDFDASGEIESRFDGDRAVLTFPASPRKRFLMINEMYDAGWTASAAEETLSVYPANVVMRGIVVPEFATQVVLKYRSVVDAAPRLLVIGVPVVAFMLFAPRSRIRTWLTRLVSVEPPPS